MKYENDAFDSTFFISYVAGSAIHQCQNMFIFIEITVKMQITQLKGVQAFKVESVDLQYHPIKTPQPQEKYRLLKFALLIFLSTGAHWISFQTLKTADDLLNQTD